MSASWESAINTVGLVVLSAALGFITTLYFVRKASIDTEAKRIAASHQAVLDRLQEVESKLALVNQAVVPLNMAMQAMLIKELTHYHTPEMDRLMQKVGPPNILTDIEAERLRILLEERTRDMGPLISASERDAAMILPIIMKRARVESETLLGAEELKLRLVTVAAVIGLPVAITSGEDVL